MRSRRRRRIYCRWDIVCQLLRSDFFVPAEPEGDVVLTSIIFRSNISNALLWSCLLTWAKQLKKRFLAFKCRFIYSANTKPDPDVARVGFFFCHQPVAKTIIWLEMGKVVNGRRTCRVRPGRKVTICHRPATSSWNIAITEGFCMYYACSITISARH